MSIFHDDLTQAYQNTDIIYYHILKRFLWQNIIKDIKEYAKICFQCQQKESIK